MTNRRSTALQGVQDALNFFVGGVPPFGYLEIQIQGLSRLAGRSRSSYGLNQTAEVCVIALSAYFEAFCKAQFAAVINICPAVLRNFVGRRKDTTLDLHNVLEVLNELENKLGNLLSEDYDFGSAKAINGLYCDLLGISPFSKDEMKTYSQFLADRNLLVHHGGIYTFGYAAQRFARRTAPGLPHWDSLVVGARDHEKWASFLLKMGNKIAESCKKALEAYASLNRIALSVPQKRAIWFFSSSRD